MGASSNSRTSVRFENFELDLRSGELRRDGIPLKLQPQPAKILALLASRPGEVITRNELTELVWGSQTFVDFEQGLNFAIRQIRTALEDDADEPRFVATVPKRGYRFIAALEEVPDSGPLGEEPSHRIRVWMVVLPVAVILAVLAWGIWNRYGTRHSPPGRIMIAVLPFQNLTGEPAQEFVSDGFTEEMITELGGLQHDRLGVIARTSSMAYKNTAKPVSQIGRELGVQYVLEGSVRRWGDRVRVTAQLIQTQDQTHVWARNYESDRRDVLHLQSEIAQAIAGQVQVLLSGEKKALLNNAQPVDPQVYELCLLGRYEWNKRNEAGLAKAIGYFQQATQRDPAYAPSYAGLAQAYLVSAFYGHASPKEMYDKAQAAAERAVQLNDLTFEAHAALGMVRSSYLRPGAEAEFKRALQINPSYATGHHWYAFELWRTGRQDDALAELERARQLDPVSPIINTDDAVFHLSAGQSEVAIQLLQHTIDLDPQFSEAHRTLAVAFAQLKKFPEATAEAHKALQLNPNNLGVRVTAGYVEAASGNRERAQSLLRQLETSGGHAGPPWFFEAWLYVGLGQNDKALDCLAKEYREGTPMMVAIAVEPIFAPLRNDPRFLELQAHIRSGE